MRLFALLSLAALPLAADQRLGKPLTLSSPVAVDSVLASPAQYVGKPVQVKGRVTEVCQMAGCWMALADPASGRLLRVKVNDGDIVFPKEAVGRLALAEGTLQRMDLTREQAVARARHEAEERNQKFDPASVKSGETVYQIRGTGAVLLD